MSKYKQTFHVLKDTQERNGQERAVKANLQACLASALPTPLPIVHPNGDAIAPRSRTPRFTPDQLRDFDDIATDVLINSVYPEVPILKNRSAYSSTWENRNDIVSIIKTVVVNQKDPARAVSLLLQVPVLKKFSDSLLLAKKKDDFQRHIRKYVDLYLSECPFEVSRTIRYGGTPQAAIRARKDIERGDIMYLCGTQAQFIPGEVPDEDDLSVTKSNFRNVVFEMRGPTQFGNHDCKPNAQLESDESSKEVKMIATRKIWTGEEITLSYEKNAFGEKNCDCLCETCKPFFKIPPENIPRYQFRHIRGEIPLDKMTLALMNRHHEELYGWAWPRTE